MNVKTQAGITLIELLIVIVIISIIALIAYPNFTNSARKAKRSDAMKSVQEVSNRLEKYMTYCNSYTAEFGGSIGAQAGSDKCTGLGMSDANASSIPSELGVYNIAIALNSDDCVAGKCMTYVITATATGSQVGDEACRSFSYSSTGRKTSTNSAAADSSSECWT